MNHAFIFDMDGVIINSEKVWSTYGTDFLEKLLGKKISEQIGDTVGMSVNTIFHRAKSFGLTMPQDAFQNAYDRAAFRVYDQATMTPDVDTLADYLLSKGFRLGLVSSSGKSWINKVLPRLPFTAHLESIISLNERLDLQPKPHPDGYVETMKILKASPDTTIILEDSNSGIKAAMASGAFTIAFEQNLIEGYEQIEADEKAKTMMDVIALVERHLARCYT